MPAPSSALSTLRPDISGSLMEFDLAMDREGFVWNRVMPVFEAKKASGQFGKIPVAQLLQNRSTLRAPGGGYSRGSFTFEPVTFNTIEYGAEEPIDDREAALYSEYFDAEVVSGQRAQDAVLRNAEKRVAELLFSASTFSGHTGAITNEWDDASNATPINDVETAVRAIWTASGLWANALVINRHVFRNLRNCDQIVERINSQGAGNPSKPSDITADMLARVFDLEKIIVAGSAKSGVTEGQTFSADKIWSDEYALVCRVATSGDIKEPCVGRVFHWAEDGSTVGGTIETYRDETVRSDIARCRHDVDEKLLYASAGYLLSNATT